MKQQALTIAGVMSGTSADGIDVAIVRILPVGKRNRITLLAHEQYPYPAALRNAVLALMDQGGAEQPSFTTAHFARLHARLGIAYADAVVRTRDKHDRQIDAVGCHGQTVYHQPKAASFLGARVRTTLQLGDPSYMAERLAVPVVSDFRPADMAAGGQGAPLVPLLDYEFFSDSRKHRVLQNLGGIGNLSLLRAGGTPSDVIAFDTGPGNMIIDALARRHLGRPYDANGAAAARGKADPEIVRQLLRASFFTARPPKSCGREQFGDDYAARLEHLCNSRGAHSDDALATATLLTAESLRLAAQRFLLPLLPSGPVDYILSGGGALNATLVALITQALAPLGFTVSLAERHGLPSEAKEAVAFALLAWNSIHGLAGNLPSATGAKREVVLGKTSNA